VRAVRANHQVEGEQLDPGGAQGLEILKDDGSDHRRMEDRFPSRVEPRSAPTLSG
jgi:hypothetical protein